MMANPAIVPVTMPKWGLSMQEGKVVEWLATVGTTLAPGDQMVDIETEKIANTFEALDAGLLRRQVAQADDVLPVGALLGVLAPESVSDAEVDAYIAEFQANSGARRFYERRGFVAVEFTDGESNEERCPDVLYELAATGRTVV